MRIHPVPAGFGLAAFDKRYCCLNANSSFESVFLLCGSSHKQGGQMSAGGRRQFYTGGQRRNQAVSATETRAAALLPLTTALAMPLTFREALVVATAASVATIMNAMAVIGKITSIIPDP
jgi:hypothetical protein